MFSGRRLNLEIFGETNDSRPIQLKEAEAVLQVLKSIEEVIRDSKVDSLVDNVAVLSVWNNQGGRDRSLNNITKQIFQLVTSCNCDLHMQYVPSVSNEADLPSRSLSYSGACLNIGSWQCVER